MTFGTTLGRTMLFLMLTTVASLTGKQASAETEGFNALGRWVGVFEFVVLGERALRGPAAVVDTKERAKGDQPAQFGEGDIVITIENQLASHFFGRWRVKDQGGALVCTMIDDTNFICGSETANSFGSISDGDSMRLCWSDSGEQASSGCADLRRPES